MSMSEQAVPDQDKTGKADRRYLSTFWESVTGEGGRLDIIDYICPHCHKNIFWQLWSATYCPHCNPPVGSAPRRKLDAKQFTNWRGNDVESMRYTGPNRMRPLSEGEDNAQSRTKEKKSKRTELSTSKGRSHRRGKI